MAIEVYKSEDFSVEFNDGTRSIAFIGTIRLQTGEEYEPIVALLTKSHGSIPAGGNLILDFSQLKFLNSSGINMLSRFVINARKEDRLNIKVVGSQDIYWQQKSLTNFQKLWPKIQIDIQ